MWCYSWVWKGSPPPMTTRTTTTRCWGRSSCRTSEWRCRPVPRSLCTLRRQRVMSGLLVWCNWGRRVNPICVYLFLCGIYVSHGLEVETHPKCFLCKRRPTWAYVNCTVFVNTLLPFKTTLCIGLLCTLKWTKARCLWISHHEYQWVSTMKIELNWGWQKTLCRAIIYLG